jgi:hypothetical protein
MIQVDETLSSDPHFARPILFPPDGNKVCLNYLIVNVYHVFFRALGNVTPLMPRHVSAPVTHLLNSSTAQTLLSLIKSKY